MALICKISDFKHSLLTCYYIFIKHPGNTHSDINK